jgi:hypothetical protein
MFGITRKLVNPHPEVFMRSRLIPLLGVGRTMDVAMEELKDDLDSKWALLGLSKKDSTAENIIELLDREGFNASREGPMTKKHVNVLSPKSYNHSKTPSQTSLNET